MMTLTEFILTTDIIRIQDTAYFILHEGPDTLKLTGYTAPAHLSDQELYEGAYQYYLDYTRVLEEEKKKYTPPANWHFPPELPMEMRD